MWSSLRIRNYRLFAGGQAVSLIGTWMQRIAQDWLVLELTDSSPVALGWASALQFGPTIALSLWGGVLADRYDKRRLLIGVLAGMGLCALILGLLDLTGVVALWQVYLLCVVLGVFSALEVPVRQAFVSELVGPDQVINAVGLNSMNFSTARIVGPAVAGLLISGVGTGWVFLLNAASFVAVIAGLLAMDPAKLFRTLGMAREPGQLRAGLRYVRGQPVLLSLLAMVFVVAMLGFNFYLTVPLLVRNVFHAGPEAYGWVTSVLAAGSLLGAVVGARRTGRPRLRVVVGAALAFGVFQTAAGLMPTLVSTAVLLVPTGMAALVFTTAANTSVQLSVDPSMRGRVMGLYVMLFLGSTPIGAPLLGLLGEHFGGRAPTVVGGAGSVVAVLLVAVWMRRVLARSAAARRSEAVGIAAGFG
jgi:MFS family permease